MFFLRFLLLLSLPNKVWGTYCFCSVSYYYFYCYYYYYYSFFPRSMNLSTADLRNYRTEFLETWWSYRYIESNTGNTGKSARQGNLRHPRVRFQSFADEARRVSKRLKFYPRVSEISLSCTFCLCLILFLTFISSCVLFDSYVLLADDHVNNVSYFPFMSIKKVIPYFCVLREYVILWLIVRICVFIKN